MVLNVVATYFKVEVSMRKLNENDNIFVIEKKLNEV